MRKTLHKYFIPHHTNEYKPHFLRRRSINFLVFLVVVVFAGSFTMKSLADTSGLAQIILPDTLVQLTNQDRAQNNLNALSTNSKLITAASMKANDMSTYGYFAHVSPQGITPWHWFKKAGYTFLHAGENLAVNFSSSHDVEVAWMNSPGHRANILGQNFKEIGIATSNGIYNGNPTIFVVQLFGAPAQFTQTKTEPSKIPNKTEKAKEVVSTQSGIVKSETASDVTQGLNEKIEVVSDTPVSQEFKALDENLIPAVVSTPAEPARISWLDKFFLTPSRLMMQVYLALSALILLAILLHIFIEIEHQHMPSIVSGITVLVLMAGLYILFVNVFGASFVFL